MYTDRICLVCYVSCNRHLKLAVSVVVADTVEIGALQIIPKPPNLTAFNYLSEPFVMLNRGIAVTLWSL